MLVKLLIARATATAAQNRGDVVEVSNDDGARMIQAEQAEAVRSERRPEKAVKRSKAEKATK